jgi:arylsulfatase A-like enzyme
MSFRMIRPSFLATLLLSLSSLGAATAAEERPNIIFILADDFRWDLLGYRGNTIIQTPNLDALAKEGVVFENAFTTTSICSVSRASYLTGQWMRRHGVNDFAKGFTEKQWAHTYPAQLRKAGYRTGVVGKLGVGNSKEEAIGAAHFDAFLKPTGLSKDYINPDDPTQTHETVKVGNLALDFVRETPQDQPYLLAVNFTGVHARDRRPREFQPDPRDETLYAEMQIPSPPTANDAAFRKLPPFVQTSEGRTRWGWRYDTPEKTQSVLRDYYRLVTGLDREVGRLREMVAARGDAGRTIFVFCGDNGFSLGDRGLADKWFMYEESLRVPALIADPREPAANRGRRVTEMTLNVDLAPTFLELAGIQPPAVMQGRSLAPWVRGETPADWRGDFLYEHHTFPKIIPPSEGVRTRDWKYIRWIDRDPVVEELFDLKKDPNEENNLAADPASAAKLEELRARWKELASQMK